MKRRLSGLYRRLFRRFGPQYWWPGETPFEVAVGAILTQNTNWGNVEKAIRNLKKASALSCRGLHRMSLDEIAELIRPAGYFNVKARRLRNFIDLLSARYKGSMATMAREPLPAIRDTLISVNGIGPETADSILLYALGKPVFVIDAYTKRVLSRHTIMAHEETYDRFQELFHRSLPTDLALYNEYHALLVRVAKDYCRTRQQCEGCPLEDF